MGTPPEEKRLIPELPGSGDEELGKFVDGVFVGHAGNIVADDTLDALGLQRHLKISGEPIGVRAT